jgi:hypothetical protein
LPIPSGFEQGEARAINAKGAIVGTLLMPDGKLRACIWINRKPTVLPLPAGATTSTAVSVNDSAVILGSIDDRVTTWTVSQEPRDVPLIYGAVSLKPMSINNKGEYVFNNMDEKPHWVHEGIGVPYLYRPGKNLVQVGHLIRAGSGYSFSKVLGLNNRGQLAVGARFRGKRATICVLTPPIDRDTARIGQVHE